MPAAPDWTAIFTDLISCLGLGLGLAALRDVVGLMLGNGKAACFVWDVLGFALGAVLLFGYASGQSAIGITRWYMVCGMAAGALGWYAGVSRVLHALLELWVRILMIPYGLVCRYVGLPMKKECIKLWNIRKTKKMEKKSKNKLQNSSNVLYN